MFFALLLAFQLPFALPDILEQWKSEIEARLFHRIEILRIPGDPVPAEDRDVLFSYFSKPDFAQSFSRTQALTFRYEREGRTRSLILLNLPRLQSTQNTIPAIIAHELGHLWLGSLGLNPPVYDAGPGACLAIHAGDIVQHILLRAESDRRGIPWRESYIRDYTAAAETFRNNTPGGSGDNCFRAQRLSLIIDVRTGFAPHSFPVREEYLAALARQDPAVEAIAIELIEALDTRLTLDPADYRAALALSFSAIERLLATPPIP